MLGPVTMKSLPLFVASILIFSGFLGCLDDSDKPDDKTSEIADNKPIATIVSINPNPAYLKQTVSFVGNTTANTTNFEWSSSIDGSLSTEKNFTSNKLSAGNHTISFRTKDKFDIWSENNYADFEVYNRTRKYSAFEVSYINGSFAPDPTQNMSEVINLTEKILTDPLGFQNSAQSVVWEEYNYNFTIEETWEARFVMLLLSVNYDIAGDSNPEEGPAGTLNLSIRDPNGGEHGEGYEIVTWSNGISERPYLLPAISGIWEIRISGSGLNGIGAIAYSGTYSMSIESEKLE
jgi:hypothetical protein